MIHKNVSATGVDEFLYWMSQLPRGYHTSNFSICRRNSISWRAAGVNVGTRELYKSVSKYFLEQVFW